MDRFLPLLYLVGWFAAVFGASYLINWLLVRSVIRRYYRFFIAPGVIVHELSHALGCLMTGSPIVEINFWKASGGHVKHLQPTDPFRRLINDPIIALAPIWGTLLLLAGLTRLMVPEIFGAIQDSGPIAALRAFDFTRQQTWLYLYLVTSLVSTIAPSKTDIRYAFASLVVISLLLVALLMVPGFSDWLIQLGDPLRPFAVFTLVIMAVGLVMAFLLALPNRHQRFVPRNEIE